MRIADGGVLALSLLLAAGARADGQFAAAEYRIHATPGTWRALVASLSDEQIGIVEKLNRADRAHLPRLPVLVTPVRWVSDELAFSVLPLYYVDGSPLPKLLVIHLGGQVFGGYEFGQLIRWGPVSSGGRARPTPAGFFTLNWRSEGHVSSVDPGWFMRWYFNFGNRAGFALHEYAMPGLPASHGCIRLLERDARWLFTWGHEWVLDARATRVLAPGTPVFLVGAYDFSAPPPWRSVEWLAHTITLPPLPPAAWGG